MKRNLVVLLALILIFTCSPGMAQKKKESAREPEKKEKSLS
jgi:hypothetical protein